LKVNTTRFGEIEVEEKDLFHLKEGILGFENLKDFFFVDPGDQTLILWLQSKEEGGIAFPVIEPKIFNPDYTLRLLPIELESLNLKDMNEASVFCILTIPRQVSEMSANLKAPLVINNSTKVGRQIVLQDSKLEMRFPVYTELKKYIVNYTSHQTKDEFRPTSLKTRPKDKSKTI
jgi:flagellar assembly factor FliW